MCDTFNALKLTKLAKKLDDGRYALSWYDQPTPAPDGEHDPAGVTSHF